MHIVKYLGGDIVKLVDFSRLVYFTVYLTALFVLGILPMLQYSAYLPSLVCFALCLTLLFVLHFALEPLCLSFNVTLSFVLRFALEPLCFRNIKLKPILENKFERPMSFIPQN